MWEVWSVECGVRSVKYGVESANCEVRNLECVECEVGRAKCGVWSVEWRV